MTILLHAFVNPDSQATRMVYVVAGHVVRFGPSESRLGGTCIHFDDGEEEHVSEDVAEVDKLINDALPPSWLSVDGTTMSCSSRR